jgi:hypothetical protein
MRDAMYCAKLGRNDGVFRATQDQRWHAHSRQDVADVDLPVHPVKRDERPGARSEPKQVQSSL